MASKDAHRYQHRGKFRAVPELPLAFLAPWRFIVIAWFRLNLEWVGRWPHCFHFKSSLPLHRRKQGRNPVDPSSGRAPYFRRNSRTSTASIPAARSAIIPKSVSS